MGAEYGLCVVVYEITDGGKRADDTTFIGDKQIFVKGYIKINPDEYGFSANGYIFD